MGPCVDTTPEVQLGVLVDERLLGSSLMEGAVTVWHDDFGPVGEDVLLGVSREQSFTIGGLGPVDGAAEISPAALVAALHGLVEGMGAADASALHIEEDLFRISFMDEDSR